MELPYSGGVLGSATALSPATRRCQQHRSRSSEDYRTALVLHDLEGQTAAQVAEIVGCSLAAAKIRIHRSRQRLKQALEKECRFYRDAENVFRCDRKLDT